MADVLTLPREPYRKWHLYFDAAGFPGRGSVSASVQVRETHHVGRSGRGDAAVSDLLAP